MNTYIVDAFTQHAFQGNPAGVCLPQTALSDPDMLRVAQELGLSETAFVQPEPAGDAFSIRYFSPKMEIPLCGHATVAAAKVLSVREGLTEFSFRNYRGLDIPVCLMDGAIQMTLPVYETHPAEAPPALLSALGITSTNNVAYNRETKILLLEIDNTDELANLSPDFEALYRSHEAINGVVVTAPSIADQYDFHSRYFWPWSGTNEDPVTGGTHTFLTSYWARRLDKTALRSFQASPRTGSMDLQLFGDHLQITASAVIVLEGEFHLP